MSWLFKVSRARTRPSMVELVTFLLLLVAVQARRTQAERLKIPHDDLETLDEEATSRSTLHLKEKIVMINDIIIEEHGTSASTDLITEDLLEDEKTNSLTAVQKDAGKVIQEINEVLDGSDIERLASTGGWITDTDLTKLMNGRNYEENDGDNIVDGDMKFDLDDPRQKSVLLQLKANSSIERSTGFIAGPLWPDGIIKYCFASDINPESQKAFTTAVDQYKQAFPCAQITRVALRFGASDDGDKTKECVESPAVVVGSSGSGCWSYVGKMPWGSKAQPINLEYPGCIELGVVIHEIGHTLGMAHEQSRSDRDNYVKVNWDNIEPDKAHNFRKYDYGTSMTTNGQPYDVLSVMHYGVGSFQTAEARKQDLPTLEVLPEAYAFYTTKPNEFGAIEIGQRMGLAQMDVDQLVSMYSSVKPTCVGNKHTGCHDRLIDGKPWGDKKGRTCQYYVDYFTPEKIAKTGKDCSTYPSRHHCCKCGGGVRTWTAPEPAPQPAIDCQYSWNDWEPCSVSCGPGSRKRSHTITTEPSKDGAVCPASPAVDSCNTRNCPVDCVGQWGPLTSCSKECGTGTQHRIFEVSTKAQYDGSPCAEAAFARQDQDCNTHPCPVSCTGHWGDWSQCSKTCGSGTQKRKFVVATKGADCPEPEHQSCNTDPCPVPVDCHGFWGPWAVCSKTCGSGTQSSTFYVSQKAAHGGADCQDEPTRERACTTAACPEIPSAIGVMGGVTCEPWLITDFGVRSFQDCVSRVSKAGGAFFSYGKGGKEGQCNQENTDTEKCSKDWKKDDFDFYKIVPDGLGREIPPTKQYKKKPWWKRWFR